MMKLALAVALGALLPTGVAAQTAPEGHHGGGMMHRDMTRDQVTQRAQMLFQALDLNHDGVLTRAEAEQAAKQMIASHGGDSGHGGDRAQRMLAQLFGSGDSVSLAQFEAKATARFDAEDLNHDGTVTADERAQARADRHSPQ